MKHLLNLFFSNSQKCIRFSSNAPSLSHVLSPRPKLNFTLQNNSPPFNSSAHSLQQSPLHKLHYSMNLNFVASRSYCSSTSKDVSSASSSSEKKKKTEELLSNQHDDTSSNDIPSTDEIEDPENPPLDRRAYYIALSSLFMGTAFGILLPVMPTFTQEIGINTAQYGAVMSVIGLARLLCNFPAAWITDRFGRKPCLVGGPILSAIGMGLTGTSTTIHELIFYRSLTGVGGSAQMAGAQSYLSDISTKKNRATTIAPLMIAFGAGSALGPTLSVLLLDRFGLQQLFYFVGGCILCVSLNNYLTLPETLQRKPRGIESKRTIKDDFKAALTQWKTLLRDRDCRSVMLVHGSFGFSTSGCIFTLMPLLATNNFGLSAAALGVYFTIMSVVSLIGYFYAAKLVDRYGRKKSIVPALSILALSVSGMVFCTSSNQLLGLVFIWSIGSTLLGSAPTAYMTDITTAETRSQGLALLRSASDLGLFLGAGLLGWLAHQTSIETSMSIGAIVLLISACNFAFRATETVVQTKKKT